jgi:1-deoxy-D-xylulose-5-phosphate reductoisomerase
MAISGISGLIPTFSLLGHSKVLAIATKEVIVSSGDLLINQSKKLNTKIIPIDSEHNAIFQLLSSENKSDIKDIIITASGGPFLELSEEDLKNVTLDDALKHPNWKMGRKNTIDSATLINKALEIIEAKYLFEFPMDKIKSIIHPESIIHGMTLLNDGTYKTIISSPDMKLPISFAMMYPNRCHDSIKALDFCNLQKITFKKKKDWQERNINLAYTAFYEKKIISFNVANEIAVQQFLNKQIKFNDIYKVIANTLDKSKEENIKCLDDILEMLSFCPT